MKTYFITGSTGAVGAALIEHLLQDEDTRFRLLVRAKDPEHLEKRLKTLMAFWGLDPRNKTDRKRVRAMAGDVIPPRFGINQGDYDALVSECTHIVHCAGNVRMNLSLEDARESAVSSAKNIAELAKQCRKNNLLEKVEFVSTVGVGGRMGGIVPETWITENRAFHNTYEHAKAEAEEFIARQIDQEGLPVTVHRPSMVVGDSRTGKIIHFQIFYHLCEFLSGRRTLGFLPNVKGSFLDIVPVDYVAKAIAWSSTQASTVNEIFHLCSGPNAIELPALSKKVRATFQANGVKLPSQKVVPLSIFKASLPLIGIFVPEKARRAMKALPVFFDYLSERQVFTNEKTQPLLSGKGIPLPPIDDYLESIFSFYLKENQSRQK
jgi:thioester reductase-like protein